MTQHSAFSFFTCKPCTAIACDLQIAVKAVESEQTKLDKVFKLLGFLYQHFVHVGDDKVKKVMLQGLETRFKAYDQPAMLIAYMLNPQRQTAFLNPLCNLVATRNAVQLVEILYLCFFPKEAEAEAQAQAKGEAGIADQFIAYMNKEAPFDESKYTALLLYLVNIWSICVVQEELHMAFVELVTIMSADCISCEHI